jgi:hypothetical protein
MSSAAEMVNAVTEQPSRLGILPDAYQLEMLRDADGKLDRHNIHLVRGRGRPKGSTNKRTKKVADYFVAKYGDPIDVLGQLTTMPLKTLVDVLMEADGGAEHRDRLTEMVEEAVDHIKLLRDIKGDAKDKREMAAQLEDAIEKLARAAQAINGKPGKLALDALALQLSAGFKALEYVHGKQPISIDVQGKADLVIFAPEILRQHGIDPAELQSAIDARGLEAIDPETLRLSAPEDAEFSEVGEPEGDAE